MKDKKLQQLLRKKLQDYETPVPQGDWQTIADQLPRDATSDTDRWRGLLYHKMASYATPLPENDWHNAMLGRIPQHRKRHTIPLWIRYTIGVAAAATIALLLMLPAVFAPQPAAQTPLLADATNATDTTDAVPASTSVVATPHSITTHAQPHAIRTRQRTPVNSVNTQKSATPQIIAHAMAVNDTAAAQTMPESIPTEPTTDAEAVGATQTPPDDTTPHISIEEAARLMCEQQSALAAADTANTYKRTQRESINMGVLASLSPNVSEIMYIPSTTIMGSQIALRSTTTHNDRHDLPFSVGLSIGIPLCKRLDLQTGVNYSYAHSRFTSTNHLQNSYSERNQQLHYIGVPLMLSFRIVDRRIIKFYVSAGGACEKGIIATQHQQLFDLDGALLSEQTNHEYIKGIQGSLTANVGLAVMFFKGMGIYFEPGFTWYIPAEKFPQPVNSRTVHPYNLSLTAGLRFNLK